MSISSDSTKPLSRVSDVLEATAFKVKAGRSRGLGQANRFYPRLKDNIHSLK